MFVIIEKFLKLISIIYIYVSNQININFCICFQEAQHNLCFVSQLCSLMEILLVSE